MNVQKLRKEISELIDNIKEHSDRVTDFERIPQLELENILSKIRKLHEKSVVFNYLHAHEAFDSNIEEQEINKQEEIISVLNNFDTSEEFKQEEAPSYKAQIKEELNNTEQKAEEKSTEKTLNDINTRLKEKIENKGSLNERIGQSKLYSSLSSKLQNNPISDLPKVIGVNERFLFIKELFDNDAKVFSDTVLRLNNLQNFAQAENILNQELAVKYNWKFDSLAVKSFVELVHRRYI